MKKLYFLLLAMVACLAANAEGELYLRGGFNGWGYSDETKLQQVDDNKWVIEKANLPEGTPWVIANDDWSRKFCEWGGAAKDMVAGGTYYVHNGGGDMTIGTEAYEGRIAFVLRGNDDGFVHLGAPNTVYFDNSESNWNEVYIYYWEGELNNNWPGTKMKKGDDGIWSYDVEGRPDKCVFNNGGDQNKTADLGFKAGATYNVNGLIVTEDTKYVVYFDNSKSNWNNVKAYYWGYDVTVPEWPGADMTEGENDVWSIELDAAPWGILFTNGAEGDAFAKTVDYAFEDGKTYEQFKKFYLAGQNYGSWSPCAGDYELATTDGYEYTIELSSLEGEWKITDGTWGWNFGTIADETYELGKSSKTGYNLNDNNFTLNCDEPVIVTFYYHNDSYKDGENGKMDYSYIKVEKKPAPIEDWTFEIRGDFNNWEVAVQPFPVDEEDGEYFVNLVYTDFYGQFAIVVNNGVGEKFYTTGGEIEMFDMDGVLFSEEDLQLHVAGYEENMWLGEKDEETGEYPHYMVMFLLNPANMTMNVQAFELNVTPITIYWDNTDTKWAEPMLKYTMDGMTFTKAEMTPVYTPAPQGAMQKAPKAFEENVYEGTVPAGAQGVVFFDAQGDEELDSHIIVAASTPLEDGHVYSTAGHLGEYSEVVTGVESVIAESEAAEYFNLQGMRVARPANGLYIRKQGSKVVKVAL